MMTIDIFSLLFHGVGEKMCVPINSGRTYVHKWARFFFLNQNALQNLRGWWYDFITIWRMFIKQAFLKRIFGTSPIHNVKLFCSLKFIPFKQWNAKWWACWRKFFRRMISFARVKCTRIIMERSRCSTCFCTFLNGKWIATFINFFVCFEERFFLCKRVNVACAYTCILKCYF